MPDARPINVANAAVALLNSPSVQSGFVRTFTAVRAYRPIADLTTLKAATQPSVIVVAKGLDTSPLTRQTVDDHVSLDVGIQAYVDPANEVAVCDVLMKLVEQIKQVLEAPRAL